MAVLSGVVEAVGRHAAAFIDDESGATAIEYGLLAAMIAVAIIVGVTILGNNVNELLYERNATCVGQAIQQRVDCVD